MSMFRTILAAASIIAAPVVFASELPLPPPPQAEAPPAAVEPPKEDPVVCKKFKTTGSRLPTEKICKKQSEWDAEAAEARRALDQGMRNQQPPSGMPSGN